MVGEKIGQIECARLPFGLLIEMRAAVELVTVGAGNADGVGIAGQEGIQRADGAAVGIADEDMRSKRPAQASSFFSTAGAMRSGRLCNWAGTAVNS